MKRTKHTAAAQLSRLAQGAAQATLESRAAAVPARQSQAEKLDALLRNVGRIVVLPLSELTLGDNVRRYVPTDTPEFAQLVDSIRRDGILQNLVADLKMGKEGRYQLHVVSGQRRFLAGEAAGVKSCPVRIMQYSDRASKVAHGIAENVLRDSLHCLDLAEGYAELLKEGWTEAQIAETFDRKRQTVMQHLRLARYPEAAKRLIRQHMDQFTSYDLLNKFVAHKWEDAESLLAALQSHLAGKRQAVGRGKTDDDLRRAGRELGRRTGYRVSASGTPAAGQVTIKWRNEAEQRALFRLLGQLRKVGK